MNDHIAADRDTLRTALVKTGVRMTEDALTTLWEALGGEPAYIGGCVYTDARGVPWYRLSLPGPREMWRDCRDGTTYTESGPARPLTLLGPVPTREQVAAIVTGINEYGNGYSAFEAGQQKLTDRIMALLKGEAS
jgi:hypothetical protein